MRARNLMRGRKNGGIREKAWTISHVIRDSSDVNVPFLSLRITNVRYGKRSWRPSRTSYTSEMGCEESDADILALVKESWTSLDS